MRFWLGHPWLAFTVAGLVLGAAFYLNVIRYRTRLNMGIFVASTIVVVLMLALPYLQGV